MIPIDKGIYMFEFQKNNIPPMAHSFSTCDTEKGYCRVCGRSSGIKQSVVCTKCGLLAHVDCSESAFSYCNTLPDKHTGYCSTLYEYLAAMKSGEQPHLIKQAKISDGLCQTCNNPIQGDCFKCLCCKAHFHITCKQYRDCKTCYSTNHKHHHLLQGAEGKCFACKQSFDRKIGFHCSWCGVNVHVKCVGKLPTHCSYGQLAPIVTKPEMETNRLVVDCVMNSEEYYWTLHHLNPRQILQSEQDYKTPIVVHCQSQQDFNTKLKQILPEDEEGQKREEGTEREEEKENIIVVTQGDLALTLGWNVSLPEIMPQINKRITADVDIWSVSGINKHFCCYFGIGIDAFYLRSDSQRNVKILMEKHVHVFLGETQLELEGFCGIILMNIPFYDTNRFVDNPDATLNDKMIEIVGFTSPNHFSLCQSNTILPKHIGTARTIKIIVLKQIDCQIDGIPFILYPGIYHIKASHQLRFLSHKPK